MIEPTPQQTKIIGTPGNLVVIARPGSGKTYVISEKIRSILCQSIQFKGVIAISFTNKAADELRGRCLRNGFEPKGSFFGTIDKFIIAEIVVPFSKHLFGLPVNEIKVTRLGDASHEDQKFYSKYYDGKSVVKYDSCLVEKLGSDFVQGVIFLELSGFLARYVMHESLACTKYLQARYTHVFIDEYQDSGVDQHKIFQKLENVGLKAVAVGDIDQSIYVFTGKSSDHLLSLAKNSSFTLLPLTTNHRSHASIVNYASSFISEKADLIETDDIRVFKKVVNGDETALAQWINSVVDHVMTIYSVDHESQIGVLVRNGRTGSYINEALKRPHRYLSGTELDGDDSPWSSLFRRILFYMFDPKVTRIDVIENIYDPTRDKNVLRKLFGMLEKIKSLGGDDDLNIDEVVCLAESCARIVYPKSVSRDSVKLLQDVLLFSAMKKNYLPAENNEIQILTLHKSKGLEFDIVFHLDLYEWVLPSKTIQGHDTVYNDWDQDSNLHYVGVTRARKACFLCYSTQRHNFEQKVKTGNPSEFLFAPGLKSLKLECGF